MNGPLVTIGIPTFNRPDGLRNTLKCITQQTYKNLEILISDNHSDNENAVRKVIGDFSSDPRVKYIRQTSNIGAIKNFQFLVENAKGSFFSFAADDDEIDPPFIEKMLRGLLDNPDCVIAITGFDASDLYSQGYTGKEFLEHLQKLPHPDRFQRMMNYAGQPDYQGKARILWGLIKTAVLQVCYKKTLEPVAHKTDLTFAELPIEFRILNHGNLYVVSENLLHVYLLPSSLGLQEGRMFAKREIEMCQRGFAAYRRVVEESDLTESEKSKINFVLRKRELKSILMVATFYSIQRLTPWLAPTLKKIWFRLTT